MLANTATTASVEGLNQMFFIGKDDSGRTKVKIADGTTQKKVGNAILAPINVDEPVSVLWESEVREESASPNSYHC